MPILQNIRKRLVEIFIKVAIWLGIREKEDPVPPDYPYGNNEKTFKAL